MKMGPMRRVWVAEHQEWEPPVYFTDAQIEGPFKYFKHTHRMESKGTNECVLEDRIEYLLPMGRLGQMLGAGMARKKLQQTFTYRHDTLRLDMAAIQRFKEKPAMTILITGASGLVGSELSTFLETAGHETAALTRTKNKDSDVYWDPAKGDLETGNLEGFDAVVHLAGENIAQGRWSEEKKQRIRDSRVQGTRMLSEALAKLDNPPKVLVSASAIGYYGDRGDEEMTESSPPGDLFISDICNEWEEAAKPAADAGIRVVYPRIGVVLTPKGGALKKMLTPFKLGMAGKFGSGKQYMSWIALDDVVGVIYHLLQNEDIAGPVNCVGPNPVTNYEFTKTLGRVLCRPTIFPMPGFAAKLVFGQMAKGTAAGKHSCHCRAIGGDRL